MGLEEQAYRIGVPVEWHEGQVLDVDELARHPDYRGPHIIEVGQRIADHGTLTARVVGHAVATGHEDPDDLKKVWHHIARFGQPLRQ
ncbi:DUF3626 domain-containing protein [Terrabacter sp. BE26]|uniref:DUF3626 domain-containing protein n=1 Tax=Terrabacter sp. BE26 TaxID=2898152 RepID=UPI0035BE892D